MVCQGQGGDHWKTFVRNAGDIEVSAVDLRRKQSGMPLLRPGQMVSRRASLVSGWHQQA